MSPRPEAFYFALHHTFSPTTAVEIKGGTLLVSSLTLDGQLVPGSRFQVFTESTQWEAFWKAMAFLDIWSWKESYDAANVRDGQGWELKIVHDGREIRSKGNNSYPAFSDPKQESLDEERWGMLVAALGELLSHQWNLTKRK